MAIYLWMIVLGEPNKKSESTTYYSTMCGTVQNRTVKHFNIINLEIIMIIRSNKILEEAVTMGIALSLKNEFIHATYMMKKAEVPHHIILRVLYDQNKIRESDRNKIKQIW